MGGFAFQAVDERGFFCSYWAQPGEETMSSLSSFAHPLETLQRRYVDESVEAAKERFLAAVAIVEKEKIALIHAEEVVAVWEDGSYVRIGAVRFQQVKVRGTGVGGIVSASLFGRQEITSTLARGIKDDAERFAADMRRCKKLGIAFDRQQLVTYGAPHTATRRTVFMTPHAYCPEGVLRDHIRQ